MKGTRSLSFAGERIAAFADPIQDIVRCGDVTIVITDNPEAEPDDYTENRNLYAYGPDGTLLWRGADQRFPAEDDEVVNPYVAIKRIDDERVTVWDYFGTVYTMVARTGQILERHWGK